MVRYGQVVYGSASYGESEYTRVSPLDISVVVDLSLDREASTDHISVDISWTARGKSNINANRFVVVRSRFGYPTILTDGEIIYIGAAYNDTHTRDSNPYIGERNYYTIWYENTNDQWWYKLGSASIFVPVLTGNERFWNLLPEFYRVADEARTDELRNFLQILDYGMDLVSQSQRTRWDILRMTNEEDIRRHMKMFGIPDLPLSPRRLRSLIGAWPAIVRGGGTRACVELLVRAVTGSDMETGIMEGYNLMLNEDQASFAHPIVRHWDSYSWWMIGECVDYQGAVYQAVAVNRNSVPSSTNYDWQTQTSIEDYSTLFNQETETISTWDFSYLEVDPVGASPVTSPFVRHGLKALGPVRIDIGSDQSADPTAAIGNCYVIEIDPYNIADTGGSPYTVGDYLELRSVPVPNAVLHDPGDPHSGDHAGNHDAQQPEWGQLDYTRGDGVPVDPGQLYCFSGYMRRFLGYKTYQAIDDDPHIAGYSDLTVTSNPQYGFPAYSDLYAPSDERASITPWMEYCSETGEPVLRVCASPDETSDALLGFDPEVFLPQSQWQRFWIISQAPPTAGYGNRPLFLNIGFYFGNIEHFEKINLDQIQVEKLDPTDPIIIGVNGTQDFSWNSLPSAGGTVAFQSSTQEFYWGTTKKLPPPVNPVQPPDPVTNPPKVPDYLAQARDSNTWRPAIHSSSPYTFRGDQHIFQGDGRIAAYITGNMLGYFWYDYDGPSGQLWEPLATAVAQGWRLKKMSIFLYRPAGNGSNRNDMVYMGWHPYAVKPSLNIAKHQQPVLYDITAVGTLRWNESKWIHVPSPWYPKLIQIAKTWQTPNSNPWKAQGFGFGFRAVSGHPFVQITGCNGDRTPDVPYSIIPQQAPKTLVTAAPMAAAATALPAPPRDYTEPPTWPAPRLGPSLRHPGSVNSGNVYVEFWAR